MSEPNETPENIVADEAAAETIGSDAFTQLQEANQRTLRVQAELENYRKRARRDMDEQIKYAELPVLRDLLPVLDNMQRAIDAAEKSKEAGSLLEGFKLVFGQLKTMMAQHNCTPIESLGAPFDPHIHEAISQMPSADQPPGTVLMVASQGYKLHDRVLRPSQVVVSRAAE